MKQSSRLFSVPTSIDFDRERRWPESKTREGSGKWVWNVGTIGGSFIIIATPSRLVGYAPTVRIHVTYNLLHHL